MGTPDELLAPLRRPLVAALALHVGDRGVAEDLAQEAMARAVLSWDRVEAAADPRAYVYRIAFNLSASRWRRRQAERRAYARHGVERSSADHRTTVGEAVAAGPEETTPDVLDVRAAVAALPDDAQVHVAKDGTRAAGGSILGLMMLGAAKGDTVELIVSGPDAPRIADELAAMIDDGFGEN